MVMVAGDVSAVESAMSAGLELGNETIVDELIIPMFTVCFLRYQRHTGDRGNCRPGYH